jgi:hypothetical protein
MTILTSDARGRITLGPKNQTFAVTELGDGSLLLEPAVALTRADLAFVTDEELRVQVAASLADPQGGVTYRRRSQRRTRA